MCSPFNFAFNFKLEEEYQPTKEGNGGSQRSMTRTSTFDRNNVFKSIITDNDTLF